MAEWSANGFTVSPQYSAGAVNYGAYSCIGFYCGPPVGGYPAEADVEQGVVYGPRSEYEGTLVGGGGETSHVF